MFPLHEKDDAIAGAPDRLVTLDAAARKMFYTRTGKPCPVCGQKAGRKSSAVRPGDPLCPECGGPQPSQQPAVPAAPAEDHPPFDDLDVLVDRLDQRVRRRR